MTTALTEAQHIFSRLTTTEVTIEQVADSSLGEEDALDQATIAEVSQLQIGRMSREELVRVVHASRLPLLLPEIGPHVRYLDRRTLERVTYLARRCCQNRERYGDSAPRGREVRTQPKKPPVRQGKSDGRASL